MSLAEIVAVAHVSLHKDHGAVQGRYVVFQSQYSGEEGSPRVPTQIAVSTT